MLMKKLYVPLVFVFCLVFSHKVFSQLGFNTIGNIGQYDLYFTSAETQMIQQQYVKQTTFAVALGLPSQFNIQLGYSPYKHVSLAVAGSIEKFTAKKTLRVEKKSHSLSASIGSYWYIRDESSQNKDYKRALLFTNQLGFSINSLSNRTDTFLPVSSRFSSNLKYNSLFFNTGLSVNTSLGKVGVIASYRRLYYREAIYSGNYFEISKIGAILKQLKSKNSYGLFDITFHLTMGGEDLQTNIGITLPIIYFQDFERQAAEIDGTYGYIGLVMDLNTLFRSGNKKK